MGSRFPKTDYQFERQGGPKTLAWLKPKTRPRRSAAVTVGEFTSLAFLVRDPFGSNKKIAACAADEQLLFSARERALRFVRDILSESGAEGRAV